jgi:putative two-component system response regulator
MAHDIALTHHEWYDGSGYPQGLVRDEIPLCGRIVALADVYDALTAKRVYKNAFTHDVAKSVILEESGVHFDPDIVDVFLECEQEFIDIQNRFASEEAADQQNLEFVANNLALQTVATESSASDE